MGTFTKTHQNGTETIGGTHPVRITRACVACADDAQRMGKTELSAWITEKGALNLGITAGTASASNPKKTHGIVYLANHPILGRAQRGALAG